MPTYYFFYYSCDRHTPTKEYMDNLESGLAAIQDNYDAAVTAATVETDDATLETEPAVEVQDAATDADETEVAEETEIEAG